MVELISRPGIIIPLLTCKIQGVGVTHTPELWGRSSQLFSHILLDFHELKRILKMKYIIATNYLTVKGITFAPCFISASKNLLPVGINPKQNALRLVAVTEKTKG